MDKILPELRSDFNRFMASAPTVSFGRNNITYQDVLKAHYLIVDYFASTMEESILYGVKDINLLGSALGRQNAGFAGVVRWKTPLDVCATLFFGLVKNHAFHDGNKRTALLILIFHLELNGRIPDCKQKKLEKLAVDVAADKYSEYGKLKKGLTAEGKVEFISRFLKKNTRKTDKRYYRVTYREFDKLLKKFDCYLDNPSNNYIDVMKTTEEVTRNFFGRKKIEVMNRRVIRIGFPGWKNQINSKAIKETLKACKLTAAHGIDSKVFFAGASPLASLIDAYKNPLARLKDK